jgi:hypothetical protein
MIAKVARTLTMIAAAAFFASANAAVEPGQEAPDFKLRDLSGGSASLAQFKGKTVVLEWNNPNCPFVRKHYGSGNMQGLQQAGTGKTVWLAINSTSPASGDFMSAEALKKWVAEQKSAPTHYLLDPDGSVGRLYGAKTTPHMYIINPQGRVVYAGAIDDKRSSNPDDIPGATNYVRNALSALAKGEPVPNASTPPYGCSVKY